MFIEAVKRGEAKHACQFLRLESARCDRATKRCHERLRCALFLDRLFKKNPQDLRLRFMPCYGGRRPHTSLRFQQRIGVKILLGLQDVLACQLCLWVGTTCPLRCSQSEVLNLGGFLTLDIPSTGTAILEGMVRFQFKRLSVDASPGFDAYDTVPRLHHWKICNTLPCLQHFSMRLIQEMYQDDEYILVNGDEKAHVHPTNGVKYGCPMLPLLFSLYVNDMGRDVNRGIRGAMTGDGVNVVSYMLYADCLSLKMNDPGERRAECQYIKIRGHSVK
eukprot:1157139-Pelagomonas_calceolata.AAC.1